MRSIGNPDRCSHGENGVVGSRRLRWQGLMQPPSRTLPGSCINLYLLLAAFSSNSEFKLPELNNKKVTGATIKSATRPKNESAYWLALPPNVAFGRLRLAVPCVAKIPMKKGPLSSAGMMAMM
jgi:hypothetical protein